MKLTFTMPGHPENISHLFFRYTKINLTQREEKQRIRDSKPRMFGLQALWYIPAYGCTHSATVLLEVGTDRRKARKQAIAQLLAEVDMTPPHRANFWARYFDLMPQDKAMAHRRRSTSPAEATVLKIKTRAEVMAFNLSACLDGDLTPEEIRTIIRRELTIFENTTRIVLPSVPAKPVLSLETAGMAGRA